MMKQLSKLKINFGMQQTKLQGIIKSNNTNRQTSINAYTKFVSKNNKGKDIAISTGNHFANTQEFIRKSITQNSVIGKGLHKLSNSTLPGQFVIGAAAMTGIAMMSGAVGKAEQIMQERYMRDSRYSSRLLAQTNVGQARANSKISIGNHTGLSLAMHRGRHG